MTELNNNSQPTPDATQATPPPAAPPSQAPDTNPNDASMNGTFSDKMQQAAAVNQNAAKTQPAPTTPAQTKQDQPHLMSKVFDGIFKTMTGGPVTYIDAAGQKQVAPQTKSQMGRAIVSAALAGLMTPDHYRQGAFGSQVRDFSATGAEAAKAGEAKMNEFRNKPQKMSDEQQTRALMNLNNTANLARNMAASALQQHAALDKMVEDSHPVMDSIREYEKSRAGNPNAPQALIADNLSLEDLQAKMKGNHMGWTAMVTGSMPVYDPKTGKTEPHPTYSIIDPNVKVPLNEETANLYATVNPTFKDAFKNTGGKVNVSMSQAVAAQHLVDESHVLQTFMDSDGMKQAFPGVKPGKVNSVLQGPEGRILASALDTTRDAISAGAPTYQTLNALQSAPGGRAVLKALGLDPDKVGEFVRDESNAAIRENALAKEGGIGDKAPVSQAQTDELRQAISKIDNTEGERTLIEARIPKDRPLTMGEFERISGQVETSMEKAHSEKLRTGDPEVLQSEASSMLNGNVSNPKDLATIRSGGARMLMDSLLQKGAEARGLNPVDHTFATQEAKAKLYGEYSDGQSKVGSNLVSFDTLARHVAEGVDANANWVRTNSKYANSKISTLEETLLNDQDYQRFKDTIIAPMKEYMSFLNANRAEHESDIHAMERALGPDSTPKSALTALTVVMQTADARAAGYGQKYLNTVKNNYEGLISPQALQVMQRLGIKSQAGPLSVQLPRGWQGNAATPINPQDPQSKKVVQQYIDATGGDGETVKKLLKENGWR